MGNQYASYGQEQSVVGKQTLTSSQELEMCVPGKSTLAEAEMSSVEGDVARVAQRAGERVVDKGHFEYMVQADGSFEISKAPVPFTASKGRRITVAELPSVWGVLHDILLAQPSQSAKVPRPAPAPRPAGQPLSQDAMLANEARVRANGDQGKTLDVAKTKADQGNAGTHYRRLDLTQGDVKRMMSGDKDANAFYCSGFAMWTLAAAGYDLDSAILGSDGKPFTYTAINKTEDADTIARFRKSERLMKQVTDAGLELAADEFPSSGKITFRKIIDGDPIAMELITKIEREALGPGIWLGVHRSRGTKVFDEMIDGANTENAAKGLAGAFELFGIGREVPELDQKPGDFAQTRKKEKGEYTGAGHAFQVWSVHATGSAIFGQEGSPRCITDESAKGWRDNVELVIDKDTNPALVGEHTITKARRIEANIEGAMVDEQKAKAEKGKKAPAGDGGVQITGDVDVPAKGGKSEDLVVFYGRLASSPWMTWTKATKPQ